MLVIRDYIGGYGSHDNEASRGHAVPQDAYFHLDGLHHFSEIIKRYGYEEADDTGTFTKKASASFWGSEVFARMFAGTLQAPLSVGISCVRQVVRGAFALITGALTLNHRHIVFALRDFVSVIVQLIVLPIIMLVALFSPRKAGEICRYLFDKFNTQAVIIWSDEFTGENLVVQPLANDTWGLRIVQHLLGKIFLIVQATLMLISNLLQGPFCGDVEKPLVSALFLLPGLLPVIITSFVLAQQDEQKVQQEEQKFFGTYWVT